MPKNRPLYHDYRGYLSPIFRESEYDIKFVEDRISYSTKNVIRGFHGDAKTYKLCTCLLGTLHLIIYDIETGNKEEHILDSNVGNVVLIKPNTLNAHLCYSEQGILFYKWSEYYDLGSQWSVNYNDKTINPHWDVYPNRDWIVSQRDKEAPSLEEFLNEKQ